MCVCVRVSLSLTLSLTLSVCVSVCLSACLFSCLFFSSLSVPSFLSLSSPFPFFPSLLFSSLLLLSLAFSFFPFSSPSTPSLLFLSILSLCRLLFHSQLLYLLRHLSLKFITPSPLTFDSLCIKMRYPRVSRMLFSNGLKHLFQTLGQR